jgi:transcriptional regulator with XRE-family HTH domain
MARTPRESFAGQAERLRIRALDAILFEKTTGAELARRAKVSQPHIANWLRDARHLSVPALDAVADALEEIEA